MNHGEMMVVWIVAIVMIASIFKVRVRGSYRRGGGEYRDDRQTQVENEHLRDEVSQLKERIKVLERITVDKENSLARQIDELRDR